MFLSRNSSSCAAEQFHSVEILEVVDRRAPNNSKSWQCTTEGGLKVAKPPRQLKIVGLIPARVDRFSECENRYIMTWPTKGATRGLLATDHVILNHGQVTRTTPELAPNLLTTTPDQRTFELSTDLTCIAPLHEKAPFAIVLQSSRVNTCRQALHTRSFLIDRGYSINYFDVLRQDAVRQRAVPSPSLEESIFSVLTDKPASSTRDAASM
ncbi:hypothetical protein TNCV_1086801 [Trichonephila clavipes]|nr:hypothetical protein TNCV_1086801 [Trichonephila clavipes]